jgi:hypothetical protein
VKRVAAETHAMGVRKWNHIWPNENDRQKNGPLQGDTVFFVTGIFPFIFVVEASLFTPLL